MGLTVQILRISGGRSLVYVQSTLSMNSIGIREAIILYHPSKG